MAIRKRTSALKVNTPQDRGGFDGTNTQLDLITIGTQPYLVGDFKTVTTAGNGLALGDILVFKGGTYTVLANWKQHGGSDFKGLRNPNLLLPSTGVLAGDYWITSVAGTINGKGYPAGSKMTATADSPIYPTEFNFNSSEGAIDKGIAYAYPDKASQDALTGYAVTQPDIDEKRLFLREDEGTLWLATGTAAVVVWKPIGGADKPTVVDLTPAQTSDEASTVHGSVTGQGLKLAIDKHTENWEGVNASATIGHGNRNVDVSTASVTLLLTHEPGKEYEFFDSKYNSGTNAIVIGAATDTFVSNTGTAAGPFIVQSDGFHWKIVATSTVNQYQIVKEPDVSLPAFIENGGAYNATTNIPNLAGTNGRLATATTNPKLYTVTVAGTQDLGKGPEVFAEGDQILVIGTTATDYAHKVDSVIVNLDQPSVEDSASTIVGQVSGQRLSQAYVANTKTRVFASNTALTTAVAGLPTIVEAKTFATAGSITDTVIYYTGDDLATSPVTHVFHVDKAGDVTLMYTQVAEGTEWLGAKATLASFVKKGVGNLTVIDGVNPVGLYYFDPPSLPRLDVNLTGVAPTGDPAVDPFFLTPVDLPANFYTYTSAVPITSVSFDLSDKPNGMYNAKYSAPSGTVRAYNAYYGGEDHRADAITLTNGVVVRGRSIIRPGNELVIVSEDDKYAGNLFVNGVRVTLNKIETPLPFGKARIIADRNKDGVKLGDIEIDFRNSINGTSSFSGNQMYIRSLVSTESIAMTYWYSSNLNPRSNLINLSAAWQSVSGTTGYNLPTAGQFQEMLFEYLGCTYLAQAIVGTSYIGNIITIERLPLVVSN